MNFAGKKIIYDYEDDKTGPIAILLNLHYKKITSEFSGAWVHGEEFIHTRQLVLPC